MTEVLMRYLSCTLTMGVLALALFALSPALGKRYKAHAMYIAWVVAALGFLLPLRLGGAAPALTAQLPLSLAMPVFEAAAQPAAASVDAAQLMQSGAVGFVPAAVQAANTAAKVAVATSAVPSLTWQQLAALIWLIGACGTLIIQLVRHALFLRTVDRWQKPVKTGETLRILEEEKRKLGIRQNVRLMLCPSVDSPMMIGLLRPRLLLPDEALTPDELPLVFRHELTHLKRHDLWVKALLLVATALHWFNPAAYLLSRSLVFWQEASCDERVTAREDADGKQFYSETIIRVIRRQTQLRSIVTTSFYGGKNGMKRRILTVLQSGKKRIGASLLTAMVALTAFAGMAFAISTDDLPLSPDAPTLYVSRQDADGAPMLWAPTANDIDVPVGAYFNGTPVSVVETTHSSALPTWGSKEGEDNWAHVRIGGNGVATGISGWIPLVYLDDSPAKPAVGTLQPADGSGYVKFYQFNLLDAPLLGTWISGKEVTLLGMVGKWWQIEADGVCGFVRRDDVTLSDDAQKRLATFRPDRFDTSPREDYRDALNLQNLYEQKAAEYGGLGIERWSAQDKAWYSQVAEALSSETQTVYYLLPEKNDLSEQRAMDIAWEAFLAVPEQQGARREEYELDTGLMTDPTLDFPVRQWQVDIRRKAEKERLFSVLVSSPSGEIVETWQGGEPQSRYDSMLALWEQQKGAYNSWTVQDKVAFSQEYGDGLVVMPDRRAISQEKAETLAVQELRDRYQIPEQELERLTPSSECRLEKKGGAQFWIISFYDASKEWRSSVMLDAHTGEVLESSDPMDNGNG